jgi:AbrB family looped-hinge helix DNA binding protein
MLPSPAHGTIASETLTKTIIRSIVQPLNSMETVIISSKFQVVIPRSIREAMGLRAGERAHVIPYQGRIEIVPVRDVRKLRGFLKGMNTSLDRDPDRL